MTATATPVIDILDRAFWQRNPHDAWTCARANDPVHRDERSGIWCITKHADLLWAERHPEIFSSYLNTAIIRFNEHIDRDAIDAQRLILLNMDPPEHTRVRGIVQRVFTPRAIRALEERLRNRALAIVEAARAQPGGSFDFVTQVACELPLQAIAELIGIPQDDRAKIFDWSNKMISYDDPEYAISEEVGQQSAMEVIAYAMNMAADRKQCPAKDIVTTLVAAEDEGNLGSDEFGFFVLMLAVAGNETTRNAITHGMHAFLTHPDQWELYKRERPATTAEEIVRFAHDPRTQQVAMLEGNRYEVLDITTQPTSEYVGLRFREMPIRGALIGAIVRDGKALFPRSDEVLEAGDRVIVFTERSRVPDVEKVL
jgi:cholest-4-en-3-one 26-monooxygenase